MRKRADAMDIEIEITPTEKLARALLRYGSRKRNRMLLGLFIQSFIWFAIFGAIGLLLGFLVERPWMYVGASIIGCGLVVASTLALIAWAGYFRRIKSDLESIRRKTYPGTRYQFTDDGIRWESELGFTFLKWRALRKLFRSDEYLLLYWDEDLYQALPTDALNEELVHFILGTCKESGVPLQL